MRERKKTLWTKDFSCITGATVLSVIGGEAMNLPLSLMVFEETQSTLLAAFLLICGMIPDVILPIIVAPLIDRGSKKKWIVSLDLLMVGLYVAMGIWTMTHAFQYGMYILFVLVIGTIYPFITICMAPIATFLYEKITISNLFYLVAGLTLLAVVIEMCIKEIRKTVSEQYTFKMYVGDIKEGFGYLKKEKGIRNIYTYMSITNGASHGVGVMTQAYYQTQPWVSLDFMYEV